MDRTIAQNTASAHITRTMCAEQSGANGARTSSGAITTDEWTSIFAAGTQCDACGGTRLLTRTQSGEWMCLDCRAAAREAAGAGRRY